MRFFFFLEIKKKSYQYCLKEYSKQKQQNIQLDRELELTKLKITKQQETTRLKQNQMEATTDTKKWNVIAISGVLILGISAIGFAIAYYRK